MVCSQFPFKSRYICPVQKGSSFSQLLLKWTGFENAPFLPEFPLSSWLVTYQVHWSTAKGDSGCPLYQNYCLCLLLRTFYWRYIGLYLLWQDSSSRLWFLWCQGSEKINCATMKYNESIIVFRNSTLHWSGCLRANLDVWKPCSVPVVSPGKCFFTWVNGDTKRLKDCSEVIIRSRQQIWDITHILVFRSQSYR